LFLELPKGFLSKLTRADVLSVFAGLRPLAAPEKEGKHWKKYQEATNNCFRNRINYNNRKMDYL
jgi:glycerol-3-phosphate dehydrogenase